MRCHPSKSHRINTRKLWHHTGKTGSWKTTVTRSTTHIRRIKTTTHHTLRRHEPTRRAAETRAPITATSWTISKPRCVHILWSHTPSTSHIPPIHTPLPSSSAPVTPPVITPCISAGKIIPTASSRHVIRRSPPWWFRLGLNGWSLIFVTIRSTHLSYSLRGSKCHHTWSSIENITVHPVFTSSSRT
ncbi:hypothetical protein HanRHA438_Chr12g0575521 [Helianthus annuus]|nr:hypothetical protein HanRHA438_Chr12g0575521 [Helianthus annuus]